MAMSYQPGVLEMRWLVVMLPRRKEQQIQRPLQHCNAKDEHKFEAVAQREWFPNTVSCHDWPELVGVRVKVVESGEPGDRLRVPVQSLESSHTRGWTWTRSPHSAPTGNVPQEGTSAKATSSATAANDRAPSASSAARPSLRATAHPCPDAAPRSRSSPRSSPCSPMAGLPPPLRPPTDCRRAQSASGSEPG